MKSPDDIAAMLRRRWQRRGARHAALLDADHWPVEITIGLPTGAQMRDSLGEVRQHLQRWRGETTGEVRWEARRYQATDAVDVPRSWFLRDADEWVSAMKDPAIAREFRALKALLRQVPEHQHAPLVDAKDLVLSASAEDVILACRVAASVQPGMAAGRPLRSVPVAGSDTKIWERQRRLLTRLLDHRFAGAVTQVGLNTFLGAPDAADHWLLSVDCAGSVLPFAQMRVRASELAHRPLPGSHLLVVENERCVHHLPRCDGLVAVLGAGLDLDWLAAKWLARRPVGYWGDLDTWGLHMLARARTLQPHISALLMDGETFEKHAALAVREPERAAAPVPGALSPQQQSLFEHLSALERGRLEQEFLPPDVVCKAVRAWHAQNVDG